MSRKLAPEEIKLLEESGYSKKAIELYVDKVNVGDVKNPDVAETYIGPCGDVIKLYLNVNKKGVIEEAKFYYLGCPGSAASTSALTQLIKGKTIEEAKKIEEIDILKALGGLPKPKMDCPKLAIKTLQKAIKEYGKKKAQVFA